MSKSIQTLLLATAVALSLTATASAEAPDRKAAFAALCQEQFTDAVKLQAVAETIGHRRDISPAEAARASAAASLGTLKLMIAERMGCPKAFPGDSTAADQK